MDGAESLFDEIVGSQTAQFAPHEAFFSSSLTRFLSDPQINELLHRLKAIHNTRASAPLSAFSMRSGNSDRESTERDIVENESVLMSLRNRIRRKGSKGMQPKTAPPRRSSATQTSGERRAARFRAMSQVRTGRMVDRDVFVENYPQLLMEISAMDSHELSGTAEQITGSGQKATVDIAFRDLSLAVKVGDSSIKVVDSVSGRLKAKTMTALMGGSGAGKTSLLNALCGRAFYGKTTGSIKINGHAANIEDHSSSVGFVPQDDIVYPELTVKENFVFSGLFQLPKGTPMEEIEDLADEIMANLGLSRVANNMVGDVTRRGVSGGEKKRVNIGLELMSRPSAIFLDEPTSGLGTCALVFRLIVCLYGVYGLYGFHCFRCFLISLSECLFRCSCWNGVPSHGNRCLITPLTLGMRIVAVITTLYTDASSALLVMKSLRNLVDKQGVTICSVIHQPRKFIFDLFDSLILLGVGGRTVYHGPVTGAQDYFESLRYYLPPGESIADWLIDISSGRLEPLSSAERESTSSGLEVTLTAENDQDAVGRDGPSGNRFEKAAEDAKVRRQGLYSSWESYFTTIDDLTKVDYDAPEPFDLPPQRVKPSFFVQLRAHLRRNFIVLRRNFMSLFIDTSLIVVGVALISMFEGVVEVTKETRPRVDLDNLISGNPIDLGPELFDFFEYAVKASRTIQEYGVKIAIITGVLVGLTAAKFLTEKRLMFFREAGSGYDVNAYFLSVNLTGMVVHSMQMVICSLFAFWLRDSVAKWHSYYVHFIMLAWLCVSWAMLIPLLVPPNNVVLATGFFMSFFGLLFSGGLAPVMYKGECYKQMKSDLY